LTDSREEGIALGHDSELPIRSRTARRAQYALEVQKKGMIFQFVSRLVRQNETGLCQIHLGLQLSDIEDG
jgi:hypothetical protein